jgi:hypothetical protein
MADAFIGSEARAAGRLTPYALRSRFVAIHPDVYLGRDVALAAELRAKACWLWSAGRSRHAPKGIRTYSDRIGDDEVGLIAGMRATTPARTALDLACR